VARDSLNIIKDAEDALDHKDIISLHALLAAARIMISHPYPYDEEDFYRILVAARNRMSEGYVKLTKKMIDKRSPQTMKKRVIVFVTMQS
jgi:hypothetical protein